MIDFKEQYKLWDEFLSTWPISRLESMSLEEYTKAGATDTFTYWIESRLDRMGSIWGGSAFKFGVYSRKSSETRTSDTKLSYSDTYGWYSVLGNSADEAYEQVRAFVTQIAKWAEQGNLDAIEASVNLGQAFKWKIAFHYQNRKRPVVVDIFKLPPLAVFIGDSVIQNMATLQKATLANRPYEIGILEFGHQLWAAWSEKNLAIWKLSHGLNDFSTDERKHYLQLHLGVMHGGTTKGQGEDFQKATIGSLFYLCHGNENLPLVGQFLSASMPCEKGDGWLQRHYRVLRTSIKNHGYNGAQKGWTPNYRSTFKQVPENNLPEFESTLLKPFFGIDLAELATLAGEPIEEAISDIPTSDIAIPPLQQQKTTNLDTLPLNCIYYGPPGTGKTYKLTQLLKSEYQESTATVTLEEWQHQFILENFSQLPWWQGAAAALYALDGNASVPKLFSHPIIQAIAKAKGRNKGVKQTLWGTMQSHALENSKTVGTKQRVAPAVFDKTADSEWHFAGDSDDACSDIFELVEKFKQGPAATETITRFSFVTFHQSYGYEEFVEGLRPILESENDSGEIRYEIKPGVFKQLCQKARQSPNKRFAMVIDEINRGNISKIFGELITLIEPDKREGMKNPIALTLPYSGESFSVPANVDIIGTMNTADRSLALIDTALRRRFEFIAVIPDSSDEIHSPLHNLRVNVNGVEINIPRLLNAINLRIEALYDRDHTIGHAYFTTLKTLSDGEQRFNGLQQIFRNKLLPLLEEYFFEDWHKIALVLADNRKTNDLQFIAEISDEGDDLTNLFGNDHGLDSYTTRRRFTVQDSAFLLPMAYTGIYDLATS